MKFECQRIICNVKNILSLKIFINLTTVVGGALRAWQRGVSRPGQKIIREVPSHRQTINIQTPTQPLNIGSIGQQCVSHKNQQNKKESKMRNGNFMFIFQQLHNFGLMDDLLTCFLSQILLFRQQLCYFFNLKTLAIKV